jgi:hypothetical protein
MNCNCDLSSVVNILTRNFFAKSIFSIFNFIFLHRSHGSKAMPGNQFPYFWTCLCLFHFILIDCFQNPSTWREYAFARLGAVDRLARELKLPNGVLHQWPDRDLAIQSGFLEMKLMQFQRENPGNTKLPPLLQKEAQDEWSTRVLPWIQYWHNPSQRIAAWPGVREPIWGK